MPKQAQALLALCLAAQAAKTENAITMPLPPTISGIEMPAISSPSMGGSFYTPGKIYERREQPAGSPNDTKTPATPHGVGNPAAPTVPNLRATLSDTLDGNYPSAADVSALSQSGLFSGIYGLIGNASAPKNAATADGNAPILQTILTEIADLKKQLNGNTRGSAVQNRSTGAADKLHQPIAPAILRFMINGSDILASCKTIYFSKPEADGTFLLTADRNYTTDGGQRSETFYLLFKAAAGGGSGNGYTVIPAVLQMQTDPASPVHRLAKEQRLTAEKTGNLVSLRVMNGGVTADLLLDIGGAK